jgi:hypothetical protein
VNVQQLNNRIKNVLRKINLVCHGRVADKVGDTVVIQIPWAGSNFYEPKKYDWQKMRDRISGCLQSIGLPESACERLTKSSRPRSRSRTSGCEFRFRTQVPLEDILIVPARCPYKEEGKRLHRKEDRTRHQERNALWLKRQQGQAEQIAA